MSRKTKMTKTVDLTEGALKVSEVEQTRQTLLEAFEESPSLVLDLSAVESCDTAGLQVLLSTLKYSEIYDKKLTVQGDSEVVHEAFSNAGMEFGAVFESQAKEI